MQINFYTTTDNALTVNKTLTLNKTINIVFRQTVDEQAPLIVMNKNNLTTSNYVYIPDFKRYYFISSVDNYTSNLLGLHLTTDLLMTYKDTILNSQVQITAKNKPSYLSANLPTTAQITKQVVKSNITVKPENSLILTTIGSLNKGVQS